MIVKLIEGHAFRRAERPVVRLQFHRALEKLDRLARAAFLRENLAVFAHDSGIVGREQHELGHRLQGLVVVALGSEQLRTADFALQIAGKILGDCREIGIRVRLRIRFRRRGNRGLLDVGRAGAGTSDHPQQTKRGGGTHRCGAFHG
jgi:hypothetical protein